MKKGLFALGLMGLLGVFGVGCGNVCDDFADLCASEASGSASGSSSSSAETECTGAAETYAQCVVDADNCDAETLTKCAAE